MVKLDVNCSNIHKETKAVSSSPGLAFLQRLLHPFQGRYAKPQGKKEKRVFFFFILLGSAKNQNGIEYSLLYSTCWIDSPVCLDLGGNTQLERVTSWLHWPDHLWTSLFVRLFGRNEFSNICLQLLGRVDFLVWCVAYWHQKDTIDHRVVRLLGCN